MWRKQSNPFHSITDWQFKVLVDVDEIKFSEFICCCCRAQIWADPSDINILPEYDRDPRVVGNLLDGNNRTRDDTHMWLAPFNVGKNHYVYLTLAKKCSIALVRIWVGVIDFVVFVSGEKQKYLYEAQVFFFSLQTGFLFCHILFCWL